MKRSPRLTFYSPSGTCLPSRFRNKMRSQGPRWVGHHVAGRMRKWIRAFSFNFHTNCSNLHFPSTFILGRLRCCFAATHENTFATSMSHSIDPLTSIDASILKGSHFSLNHLSSNVLCLKKAQRRCVHRRIS